MTTRKPDIAEALAGSETKREQGAPTGAPASAPEAPGWSMPAGEPEAPVTPVASVKSESVAAPPEGTDPKGTDPTRPDPARTDPTRPGPARTDPTRPGPTRTGPAGTETEAAEAPAEDHERQVERDLELLTAKAEKADEYLELAQRTRADFENYRKRAAREAAAAQERGITKLAKELLPAVDNLDRALQAAQTAADADSDGAAQDNGTATLVSGIKLVHEDVIAALARAGIERFSPEGERFDPQLHEAVAQIRAAGAESGSVVEVYQRGYRIGDVVIRPARVVVAA